VSADKKKHGRTKRANGRLILNGRGARGRRQVELVRIYAVGANLDDERQINLIKSAAAMQLAIEGFEDKIDLGQSVDHIVFARLVGARERALTKLAELKAPKVVKAKAQPGDPSAVHPSVLALREHLAMMARRAQEERRAAPEAHGGPT
jgi:hypothetical protein